MKTNKKVLKAISVILIALIILNVISLKSFAILITDRGSLKVSNIEAGVKVSLYKLTKTNYDYEVDQPIYPPYEWDDSVKTYLETTAGKDKDYSAYSDPEVFAKNVETNSTEAANFYDFLASVIKGEEMIMEPLKVEEAPGVLAFPVETNSEVEFTDLEMGTYLIIIENGYMVYRPTVVNITPVFNKETEKWEMSKPEVEIKASNIGIEKTVNEEQEGDNKVSTTDIINFDIRTDVPQYLENSLAKEYQVSDKFSEALTLIEDSIKVYGVNGTKETLLTKDVEYKLLTQRPNEFGESTFTLKFDYEQIKQYETIHVDYNVKLNENETTKMAGEGNPNHAYLDYSNNPYDGTSWKTQEDEEKVYTYELTITKVDRDDHNILLTGAEFVLSESPDGSNPMTFKKYSDGVYYKSNEEGAAKTLEVGKEEGNKGKLELRGLDNGTYYLLETKAPNEYNRITTSKELVVNNENAGYIVENVKTFQLPITGGMGTTVLTVVGSIFVLTGLVLIIIVNKKSKTKEEK